MLSKHVTLEEALYLLDLDGAQKLEEAERNGLVTPLKRNNKKVSFVIQDLVVLKLALAIVDMGLTADRAIRYAEAVLGVHSSQTFKKTIAWVDGENHELFCMFADKQLSRIFLRSLDDNREMEVGAEKPVLFPLSRCELNVSRTIRPVITRAYHTLNSRKKPVETLKQ
ncbi:MAG: hypothetical protein NTY51_08870 [Deltaproteobacteria bacterium]|nr:hypothetical protein [Deltaproteobacteria bacterium]